MVDIMEQKIDGMKAIKQIEELQLICKNLGWDDYVFNLEDIKNNLVVEHYQHPNKFTERLMDDGLFDEDSEEYKGYRAEMVEVIDHLCITSKEGLASTDDIISHVELAWTPEIVKPLLNTMKKNGIIEEVETEMYKVV